MGQFQGCSWLQPSRCGAHPQPHRDLDLAVVPGLPVQRVPFLTAHHILVFQLNLGPVCGDHIEGKPLVKGHKHKQEAMAPCVQAGVFQGAAQAMHAICGGAPAAANNPTHPTSTMPHTQAQAAPTPSCHSPGVDFQVNLPDIAICPVHALAVFHTPVAQGLAGADQAQLLSPAAPVASAAAVQVCQSKD